MSSPRTIQALVTGDYADLRARLPTQVDDTVQIQWTIVSVLAFESLQPNNEQLNKVFDHHYRWAIFTSPRSVAHWTQLLLEHGQQVPENLQIAAIGKRTAELAEQDGYSPDFVPEQAGSEGFLAEFLPLLSGDEPIVILGAEKGRETLNETLTEKGYPVDQLALYRTVPRKDVKDLVREEQVNCCSLFLFTSPSSASSFLTHFKVPKDSLVVAMGSYTSEYLQQRGFKHHRTLPDSNFQRIGEVLC